MIPRSSSEHKGSVLVVEDDGLVAEMIKYTLMSLGYHTGQLIS